MSIGAVTLFAPAALAGVSTITSINANATTQTTSSNSSSDILTGGDEGIDEENDVQFNG